MTESTGQQGDAKKRAKGISIAGMVLGICSIVLVWFGFILGVLAIILSSVGLKRAKNGFAVAGLVTGIVGTVFGLIIGAAMIIGAFFGIQQSARDAAVRSDATSVQKKAEQFNAAYEAYPSFEEMRAVLLNDDGYVITIDQQGIESGTDSGRDILYIPCYGYGAIIWYWSSADDEYKSLYAGDTASCEWN